MARVTWLGAVIVLCTFSTNATQAGESSVDCPPGERSATAALGSADAHLLEARCHLAAQRHAEALLAIERLLALRPGDEQGVRLRETILALISRPPALSDEGTAPADFRRATSRAAAGWQKRGLWLGAFAGYDTNADGGTDATTVTLPLYRNLVIDVADKLGDGIRRASSVLGVNGGFAFGHGFGRDTELSGSGYAGARYNPRIAAYLPHDYWLDAQARHRIGSIRASLALTAIERMVGRHRALESQSVTASVALPLREIAGVVPFVSRARNRMPVLDDLKTRELRYGVALTFGQFPVRAVVHAGSERSIDQRRHLDRNYSGFGVQWSYDFNDRIRLHLGADRTRSHYVEYSQLFLNHRLDRLTELRALAEYRWIGSWVLVPRLVLQYNDSNVQLSSYRRNQLLIEARREF